MPASRTITCLFLALLLGLSSGPAMAEGEPRIAVLELKGKLPRGQLSVMSDKVRAGVLSALAGTDYVVMSRENMAMLIRDMGLDCESAQGECEVETGRNIGAAYVVSGSVEDMGGLLLCTIKIHDTKRGALKAAGDARGKVVMDLVDQLPPTAARLTAQAFGKAIPVGQAPAPVVHQGPAQARFQGSFGTGGGLDVEAKLKEQQCARESEQGGQQARGARMVEAVERVQGEARRAWQSRASELELCTKLKRDQRSGCISAVEQWLSGARSMTVRLPAGVETVQTACGARQPAYQAEVKVVSAIDLPVAEALLSRLKAGDFSAGPKPSLVSGATRTQTERLDRFWSACEGGDRQACLEVGYILKGGAGVRIDAPRAARLYEQACDAGVASGCLSLGGLYANGHGVGRSESRAADLYQKACDLDDGRSCSKLAGAYKNGKGVTKSERRAAALYSRAAGLLQRGCDAGKARDCASLGYLHLHGLGVSKSDSRALSLHRQACEADIAIGCSNLGYQYDVGRGVTKSYSRAVQYYRQACEMGAGIGCENLGLSYYYGQGVSKSTTTARKYYKKACDMGRPKSCARLR